jgi:hypothetical protein
MNLRKGHVATLTSLLHGKLSHDVKWNDIVGLIEHLGVVEDHGHSKIRFRIGTEQSIFHRTNEKTLTTEELSRFRQFLKSAAVTFPDQDVNKIVAPEANPHVDLPWVVVIDHHVARFYHATGRSRADSDGKIVPLDPHGFHRHLLHRNQTRLEGQRIPEDHQFYEEVTNVLKHAPAIVIIGHGTGKSNAADFLKAYLEKHHGYIADRIVAEDTVDLSVLTDPQIEAIAERHYAAPHGAALSP